MFTITENQRSSEETLMRPQHFQTVNENHLANSIFRSCLILVTRVKAFFCIYANLPLLPAAPPPCSRERLTYYLTFSLSWL